MESYIIRVYRRKAEDEKSLVGTIEIVETQEKRAFNNFDELRELLRSHDSNANHHQMGINIEKQRRKFK